MKTLRILIADDYEVVRCGVRALLEEHEGWEVCGEAVDGRDAVNKAAQLHPHIVILDIGMPNLNGLEAARQILRDLPDTRVIVLTMDESEQSLRDALRVGVRGIVLKSDAARDLVLAVEAVRITGPSLPRKLQKWCWMVIWAAESPSSLPLPRTTH